MTTMETDMASYRTTRDIVIPAGTKVGIAPDQARRFTPHASVLVGVTKDTTAEWVMDLDEAIEAGLVEAVPEREAESAAARDGERTGR
jgi:hypothetical protein